MNHYKFDRYYLKSLLKDSKLQYNDGIISKCDYDLIQTIVNNLLHGNKFKCNNTKIFDLDIINSKMNRLKQELGMDLIEKLFYISDSIVSYHSYYKIYKDYYKESNIDLVTNVLNFYSNYDYEQYKYLDSIVHEPNSQLEIVKNNFINRKIYFSGLLTIPFYEIEFIRIIKENRLYDEAVLCHELRHMIDIINTNISSLDFNAYSEVNSISMELYYEFEKQKSNDEYKIGIKERMNQLRYIAKQVNAYMELLIVTENDKLSIDMIEEIFDLKTKKELRDTLLELSNDSGYELITYFIGTIKGIYLCNIALDDKKEAKKLQDKICSILTSNSFIPKNIENKVGKEFNIRESDIKIYKKFNKILK